MILSIIIGIINYYQHDYYHYCYHYFYLYYNYSIIISIIIIIRLHVPRNPRVFCCQVNMTSADCCEIVIYKQFHAFFWQIIMDSLLTYLSFISVLKMTASETNFGMTKTCFFIAFRVWFGTLNFDIGRGNFMYCMQASMMSSIFHWLGHGSQVFGMWTFWTSIRGLQDQSGKGNQTIAERSMTCVCVCASAREDPRA